MEGAVIVEVKRNVVAGAARLGKKTTQAYDIVL